MRDATPRGSDSRPTANWLSHLVHAAGGGISDSVSGLSARPRRLAVVHRRPHRPLRRFCRARKLRMAVGRLDVLALGIQHAALYGRRQHHQIRGRALSRAAAQREAAVQGDHSRRGADPVHRADGAVGHRVLVAVRSAVLDHFVVAEENGPDHEPISIFSATSGMRAGR